MIEAVLGRPEAVPTLQSAPCWLIVTNNGRYAYVANAGIASITGYHVAPDGTLSRVTANGVTDPGSTPTQTTSPDAVSASRSAGS